MNFNLYLVDPKDLTNEQAIKAIHDQVLHTELIANITFSEYTFAEGDYIVSRDILYRVIGHVATFNDSTHRLYCRRV